MNDEVPPNRGENEPRPPQYPSHAEAARTLVAGSRTGALSTLDRTSGHPYGSVVDLLALPDGDIALFLSDLAEHTQNALADARASILVAETFAAHSPLALQRVTVLGALADASDEADALRGPYLERHPEAADYIDFKDFRFFRLRASRLRYIAGFGRMSWVTAPTYRAASPDPLLASAPGILDHMNRDHLDALQAYARKLANLSWAEDVHMLRIDRFGFDLAVHGDGQKSIVRLNFTPPLKTPAEVRPRLVALVERARQKRDQPAP